MSKSKKIIKRALFLVSGIVAAFALFLFSILQLDDDLSTAMRASVQTGVNAYIADLSKDTANNQLSSTDQVVLHICALTGVAASYFSYPEASKLLYHYIYADGETLELSSAYFQQSEYIRRIIKKHGKGQYGPITLRQKDDWRLSLALNPYFININDNTVKIYHPRIAFAQSSNESVFTIVPLGKLKLKIYDNIISALKPTPFYVYAEWRSDTGSTTMD